MKQEDIIEGVDVTHWDVIDEDGDKDGRFDTVIKSSAFTLSNGDLVCYVQGKHKCVNISHLEKR